MTYSGFFERIEVNSVSWEVCRNKKRELHRRSRTEQEQTEKSSLSTLSNENATHGFCAKNCSHLAKKGVMFERFFVKRRLLDTGGVYWRGGISQNSLKGRS